MSRFRSQSPSKKPNDTFPPLFPSFLTMTSLFKSSPPKEIPTMAPSRHVPLRQVVPTPPIRGGIRRSQRVRRVPPRISKLSPDHETITLVAPATPTSKSEVSAGDTWSSVPLDNDPSSLPTSQPTIDLQAMNRILAQREDQLAERIRTQLAGTREHPFDVNHNASIALLSHQRLHTPADPHCTQGTGIPNMHGTC